MKLGRQDTHGEFEEVFFLGEGEKLRHHVMYVMWQNVCLFI
jgi:hypothetical protein